MSETPQHDQDSIEAIYAHVQALTSAVETLLIHARWQAGNIDRQMYDDLRQRLEQTHKALRETLKQ